MPNRDRFDGLAAALEAADVTRECGDSGEEGSTEESDSMPNEPAFPFDATTPHSVYVRDNTLAAIDDVEALVDARLRTERGIRNLTTREFYEAVLQVAIDDSDGIIQRVMANRIEASDR